MHPQARQERPGDCYICGMALEAEIPGLEEDASDAELRQMSRRFWGSLALALPVAILGMRVLHPSRTIQAVEALLAPLVVFWGGRPFFERAWQSIVHRSLNMFTLIALGTGSAYLYSLS